ncbi:hypothetical protein ACF0H5_003498 [Mactra antiquata]
MASSSSKDDVEIGMKKSVKSYSSTASRKRKAELRLLQLRERQEAERRSEEAKREVELQTARHEVELAELGDEEADSEDGRDLLVRDYVNNLPDNEIIDKCCENVTPFKFDVQDVYGLPKPKLIIFYGNPADNCKFLSNFESNIETRMRSFDGEVVTISNDTLSTPLRETENDMSSIPWRDIELKHKVDALLETIASLERTLAVLKAQHRELENLI